MNMLQARDIHKSFGNLEVLRGVTLSISPGEITAIVGASGAGKTTLLQILGTLMKPDSGEVLYGGEDVTRMTDKELSAFRCRHVGFVFQFHQLLPEFTAKENVMLPALLAGMKKSEAMRKADELLLTLDISDRAGHKPSALSGGERQRVAVARALINNPDIVMADEPTGSLDTHNRDEMLSLFSSLRDRLGQGFVIVTHDMAFSTVASRIITMSDGAIMEENKPCVADAMTGIDTPLN